MNRKRLLYEAFVVLTLALVAAARAATDNGQRWWSYIEALANDGMKGRNTGSPEHLRAAQYVAGEFQKAGLSAAGTDGFLQPVPLRGWKIVEPESSLVLVRNGSAKPLKLGDDAFFARSVKPAASVEANLVFAGYGLTVPEAGFDDFKGLDVRGKIIVMMAGGPSTIAGPLKAHYQNARERARFLERAGVVGTVTIQNPRTNDIPWSRSALARFLETMELADEPSAGVKLAVTLNPARADDWLAGTGHTLNELLDLVGRGQPLPHFALPLSLRARAKVEERQLVSQNVAGIRPGADPTLKNEYVVLSAHLDHLGVGQPIDGDPIYNGAMDDASGVATLLDMASQMAEEKVKTRRSLLFLAVTGEEKGELGSQYFAAHPTVDAKALVADLNEDMFLPLYPFRLATVYGLQESDLGDLVRDVARTLKVEVQDDPAPQRNIFIRSDQYSFIRRGVPSLMVAFGNRKGSPEERIEQEWLKTRYHAPSDDLKQPVDREAAKGYNTLILKLAETVADRDVRPKWKATSFFRRFAQ